MAYTTVSRRKPRFVHQFSRWFPGVGTKVALFVITATRGQELARVRLLRGLTGGTTSFGTERCMNWSKRGTVNAAYPWPGVYSRPFSISPKFHSSGLVHVARGLSESDRAKGQLLLTIS